MSQLPQHTAQWAAWQETFDGAIEPATICTDEFDMVCEFLARWIVHRLIVQPGITIHFNVTPVRVWASLRPRVEHLVQHLRYKPQHFIDYDFGTRLANHSIVHWFGYGDTDGKYCDIGIRNARWWKNDSEWVEFTQAPEHLGRMIHSVTVVKPQELRELHKRALAELDPHLIPDLARICVDYLLLA